MPEHQPLEYALQVGMLNGIARQAELLAKATDTVKLHTDKRDWLIRRALTRGIPAIELSRASGLSIPRIYQIRDGRR